jgi:hypothetical protein
MATETTTKSPAKPRAPKRRPATALATTTAPDDPKLSPATLALIAGNAELSAYVSALKERHPPASSPVQEEIEQPIALLAVERYPFSIETIRRKLVAGIIKGIRDGVHWLPFQSSVDAFRRSKGWMP